MELSRPAVSQPWEDGRTATTRSGYLTDGQRMAIPRARTSVSTLRGAARRRRRCRWPSTCSPRTCSGACTPEYRQWTVRSCARASRRLRGRGCSGARPEVQQLHTAARVSITSAACITVCDACPVRGRQRVRHLRPDVRCGREAALDGSGTTINTANADKTGQTIVTSSR